MASVNKRECRSRWTSASRVACTRKNRRTGVKSGGKARERIHRHGRLYFPVGLISIIRKRITHSLHAPSTWSVSLHSPHSPNSRYPLTRVAHTSLLSHSSLFRLGRRAATTIVPSVVHFASCHLPRAAGTRCILLCVFLSLLVE